MKKLFPFAVVFVKFPVPSPFQAGAWEGANRKEER